MGRPLPGKVQGELLHVALQLSQTKLDFQGCNGQHQSPINIEYNPSKIKVMEEKEPLVFAGFDKITIGVNKNKGYTVVWNYR